MVIHGHSIQYLQKQPGSHLALGEKVIPNIPRRLLYSIQWILKVGAAELVTSINSSLQNGKGIWGPTERTPFWCSKILSVHPVLVTTVFRLLNHLWIILINQQIWKYSHG
jgi:hypothetical protein